MANELQKKYVKDISRVKYKVLKTLKKERIVIKNNNKK
jgi:hypothetical protein